MARSPRRAEPRRERRSGNRQRESSTGDLLPRGSRDGTPVTAPKRSPRNVAPRSEASKTTTTSSLSHGSLARLDALNEKLGWNEYDNVQYRVREKEEGRPRPSGRERTERVVKREHHHRREDRDHNHYREISGRHRGREKRRIVSGPLLEEGGNYAHHHKTRKRGGAASEDDEEGRRRKRKRKCKNLPYSTSKPN